MSVSTGVQQARLDALTGLRFIAAAMIVAHHVRGLNIPVPDYSLDHGVSFFFILSGFILAYVYPALPTWAETANFLVARVARLWPAHVVALLFAIVAFRMPIDRTFLANLFLVQGWIPSWPWYFGYNAPSWSISTELFFYLCFPFLILDWRRSWWWKWTLTALLVAAAILAGIRLGLPSVSSDDRVTLHGLLYINPIGRLFEFVTGMVACSAFRLIHPHYLKLPAFAATLVEIAVFASTACCVGNGLTMSLPKPHVSPAI